MNRTEFLSLTLPLLAFLSLGCTSRPVEHTVKKVPAETSDDHEHARAEFEGMLKDKLEKLEEEIRELKMKAGKLTDTAKDKWAEEVAELDAKQKAARKKLDDAMRSSGAAWEHLRDGAKKAWEELEEAVEKARSEY
jgi:hypothetical protein